ncbi:hypothetical protein DB88DRAFT_494466 [Papiliotrema laurentii]|uniref:Uncharacterized protein n=1 Tax=Papiliotrema laurentii TaxID=5418 RepID=A0AAD9FQI9_PAPLA|nr:hypothetical protein DB88DRAFT_494466 [Papiliotrema laurentii]
MQNITAAASAAAEQAASFVGLNKGTGGESQSVHSHAEEHHRPTLPPDAKAEDVQNMDEEGLAAFEEEGVRHAVLVKINKLAIDDVKHGLKEVAALDLVQEGGTKKGISYYHPKRYFKVHRPIGIDYIGEIEIEPGKSIHVRVHKAGTGGKPSFHSIDTRPSAEGGAVFNTGEPLHWFNY